jgi:hypothetical protein
MPFHLGQGKFDVSPAFRPEREPLLAQGLIDFWRGRE